MIYKKYAIEIIISQEVVTNTKLSFSSLNSDTDNLIRIENTQKFISEIYYMNKYGHVYSDSATFDTYKEAYEILNENYYSIKNTFYDRLITTKIVEVFDDIKPPIKILRKQKLNEILSHNRHRIDI